MALTRETDVLRAGAVTASAIDSFRQLAGIDGFGEGLLVGGGDARVSIVAEHAVIGDGAAKAFVVHAVVAGVQRQSSAVFGIDREGKFDEGVLLVRERKARE
jgi:hypothetical protein